MRVASLPVAEINPLKKPEKYAAIAQLVVAHPW